MSTHSTMVTALWASWPTGWLGSVSDTVEVMEATSDYWRPPFYLFEAHGLEPWLVEVPKTWGNGSGPAQDPDRLDAAWLCKLAERPMLAAQLRPAGEMRQLRTSPATASTWSGCAARRRTGWRSGWRTPA